MTLVQVCDQILQEMGQTIHKIDGVIERLEKKQNDLKAAKKLPLFMGEPEEGRLIEGPHFPGVG
jgi:hypothetical protein